MPTRGTVVALLAATVLAAACERDGRGGDRRAEPASPAQDRIAAGGVAPAANALGAPRPTDVDPSAGAGLFSAMNCDGCHGGGAVGWVGPSLVDGRWRYGGSAEEIFTSIFYGRPKGMPAYGGVIGTDGVWMLVSYIRDQAVPTVVPTTSWLPGGSVTATPPSVEPEASVAQAPVEPERMPAKYGCTACHAVDRKVIGPAFKEVAARYGGKDAEEALVEKVKNGGAGVWGEVPMPPNPQVPDEDLHAVVRWILAL